MGSAVSEPTYRIELTHDPASGTASLGCPWRAHVYRITDDEVMTVEYGSTRERAFDNAQAWARSAATVPESPSTVCLTEDGDIHDPHDTPNLRSVS